MRFTGSVSAGRHANTIGRTASSGSIGRTASPTRLAERLVRAAAPGEDSQPGVLTESLAVGLPQHADQHRPEDSILLAVDQQLGERPRLRVPVELADPVSALEVGEREDAEQLSARSWAEGVEAFSYSAFELVRSHLRRSARGSSSRRRGRPSVDEVLHQKMKPNQGDGSQANIESARASALSVSSRTWPIRARRRNDDPPR